MLTYEDGEPSIRFAITRRLSKEAGVKTVDVRVKKFGDSIRVGVWTDLDDTIYTTSIFELPLEFDIAHVRNEVDQIAEQLKAARRDHFGRTLRGQRLAPGIGAQLAGTGLRGLWKQHA
jgi:hypothetical protein